MRLIAKAIAEPDLVAATEILKVMAAVHPREAVEVYDDLQAALRLRRMLSKRMAQGALFGASA